MTGDLLALGASTGWLLAHIGTSLINQSCAHRSTRAFQLSVAGTSGRNRPKLRPERSKHARPALSHTSGSCMASRPLSHQARPVHSGRVPMVGGTGGTTKEGRAAGATALAHDHKAREATQS